MQAAERQGNALATTQIASTQWLCIGNLHNHFIDFKRNASRQLHRTV